MHAASASPWWKASSARIRAPELGRFDAVNLNNVLEHVPDPAAILLAARGILNPAAVLCVNVPHDFSPLQVAAAATRGTGEWGRSPAAHLNYFDFATLANLLERLDFHIEEKTTSFPMEAFLLMGDNYTKDPALGRACHGKRKNFDLALESAGWARCAAPSIARWPRPASAAKP